MAVIVSGVALATTAPTRAAAAPSATERTITSA